MTNSLRRLLISKIHGAVITEANVDYEGSVTIPEDILEQCGLLPNEAVAVWNITTGTRLETYILKGVAGSAEFHINGAAAHLVSVGDRVIIAGFGLFPYEEAVSHQPKVIFLNTDNSIKSIHTERPRQVVGM
jgi:aspartate 1-decarboxylase